MTDLLLSGFLDSLVRIDSDLLLAINGVHSRFFDFFMPVCTDKLVWIPLYLSLLYVLFRNMSFKTAMFCLVCIALAAGLADVISSKALRFAVMRLRPSNLENELHELVHIVDGYRGGRYGFPSSHAANTFSLAVFMVCLYRCRVISFFMVFWALLNCYTRLYLGVHYPGDILAGAVLGTLLALVFGFLFLRISKYKAGRNPKSALIPVWVGLGTILCILGYSAVMCVLR